MANCASFRGQNLFSRNDASGKYVEMMGKEAMLYFPVNILPNVTYKVQVEMSKKSGNGIFHCNIYGNREYDFPQVKMVCEDNNWRVYSFNIETKSFPNTVPMVFRIWRNPDGLGSIYIRKITVELMEDDIINNDNDIKFYDKLKNVGDILEVNSENKGCNNLIKKIKHFTADSSERKEFGLRWSAGSLEKFTNKISKKIPEVVGEDGIKVSVVISIFNRQDLFERSLYTYSKQTMSKEEFEIVVVDDNSSQDINNTCKFYASKYGMNIQYILVDKEKSFYKQQLFNQALTNNIGFKNARGSVIIIVGPETMLDEDALKNSWIEANNGNCVYGKIYCSSVEFRKTLETDSNWYNLNFEEILKLPGAKYCVSQLDGFWWYFVAVRKEHIMALNGVDERYLEGITAEDDNFAFRMDYYGVPLVRSQKIIGIHQCHYDLDEKMNDVHSVRFKNKDVWNKLREHNIGLLTAWFDNKTYIANENIDWGTEKAIVKKEVFKK